MIVTGAVDDSLAAENDTSAGVAFGRLLVGIGGEIMTVVSSVVTGYTVIFRLGAVEGDDWAVTETETDVAVTDEGADPGSVARGDEALVTCVGVVTRTFEPDTIAAM